MPFFQEPPAHPDLFQADTALQRQLARRLPPELLTRIQPQLEEIGRDTAGVLPALSDQAEAEVPRLQQFDAWGRRVDVIHTSPAWDKLQDYAADKGIVATGYDPDLGPYARLVQAAKLHLYSASSAIYSCPLAMTDAAARVLLDNPDPAVADLLPRLLSTDPETFITSGQWMTERPGGSDVGGTETVARPVDGSDVDFTLHGFKWFTSATTSEMALTLARIDDGVNPPVPGSRGLTMFAVRVERSESGGLKGIQVDRLKDKLGTRALPTAELTLDGLPARRIGPVGRGVPTIATMLNITRYYNAVSSCSNMARGVFLARDYATRRQAFGRLLQDLPLHDWTLRGLEAELHGGLALTMEVAELLGRVEAGVATEAESIRLRALLPLAKLTLGKQAVASASEALECFGGAGYVEDTGLPRLLRDGQVLAIWEGTTNVLSLDLLRAEARDGAVSALLQDLMTRAAAIPDSEPLQAVLARIATKARELSGDRARMEAWARRIALTLGYAAEAVFVGETPDSRADFDRLVADRLMAPLS